MSASAPAPAPPPPPDVSIALRFLGITIALFLIAIPAYSFRMYRRIRPVWNLGLDDLAISLGLLSALVTYALILASIPFGFGRHNIFVAPSSVTTVALLNFSWQPAWAWSMSLIKISIAFMFLRIKQNRSPWRVFLYAMIAIQVVTAVIANCAMFLQCRPLKALWDHTLPSTEVHCWALQTIQGSIYLNSAICISTDIVFAILPITLIRKIERPLWEKVVVCILMGLGVLASIASIAKTTLARNYGKGGDSLWDGVAPAIWSMLELQLGLIAACAPCMKSPFENLLRRLRLVTDVGDEETTGRGREKGEAYTYYRDEEGVRLGYDGCCKVCERNFREVGAGGGRCSVGIGKTCYRV